jgi:hypothetical protein
MGKHLDIYGKDKDRKYRRVDLVFPVAEESAVLHRPSTDEADEIEASYSSKTDHIDIWKATYVMKFLSDEPNLRDVDDIELYNEVYALELPDRKAILDTWEAMQGYIPDSLKDMMATQLFREMNERKA